MGKKWPNKTQTEQLANDIYDMLRRDGPLTRDDICWPTCGVRAFRYARRLLLEQGRPIVSIGGRFKIARSQRDLEAAARVHRAAALTMLRDAARLLKVSLPGMLRQMELEEAMRERGK